MLVDQADEDVLERALAGVQVLEADAEVAHPPEQGRDAGPLGIGVEGVEQFVAVGLERQVPFGELGRDRLHHLGEVQGQLLAAELLHQGRLLLDQDQLALADHADPVGHLLGLLDIMGGEDDGDAALAEAPDQLPHVAAQLDVDAGGRLVEEQDVGLVAERLGDHHPALHAARQVP